MKLPPKDQIQQRAIEFGKDKKSIGYLLYYGAGKTYVALAVIEEWLKQQRTALPCLVLAKSSLLEQWKIDGLEKFTTWKGLILEGSSKKRCRLLDAWNARPAAEREQFILCNYDATRNGNVWLKLVSTYWPTVIVDEGVFLGNIRTQRFEKLERATRNSEHKILLTGRNVEKDLSPVFGQMKWLDGGKTFGRAYWNFQQQYFEPDPYIPHRWHLKPGALQVALNKMKSTCLAIPKSEATLPEQTDIDVTVDFPENAQKVYRQLQQELLYELDEGTAEWSTQWAVARCQKQWQLCQGAIYRGKHDLEIFHDSKIQWLQTQLPTLLDDCPVIVWSHYKRILDWMQAECKIGAVVHGDRPATDNQTTIAKFREGKLPVLWTTIKASGEGLNLQNSWQAIYLSVGDSSQQYDNSRSRIHRIGQTHACMYTHLLARGTLEKGKLQAARDGIEFSEGIFRGLVQ